jgi:hypothetical protein
MLLFRRYTGGGSKRSSDRQNAYEETTLFPGPAARSIAGISEPLSGPISHLQQKKKAEQTKQTEEIVVKTEKSKTRNLRRKRGKKKLERRETE